MAEHKCKYDIEIGQLTLIVSKIDKLLTDNGHDGLPTAVTKLNMKVDTLNERLEKMDAATNIDIDGITIADYFEDVNNGNPRLKGTATNAIDAGSSMTLFTDDLYGNERDPNIDIGACEYQP